MQKQLEIAKAIKELGKVDATTRDPREQIKMPAPEKQAAERQSTVNLKNPVQSQAIDKNLIPQATAPRLSNEQVQAKKESFRRDGCALARAK